MTLRRFTSGPDLAAIALTASLATGCFLIGFYIIFFDLI